MVVAAQPYDDPTDCLEEGCVVVALTPVLSSGIHRHQTDCDEGADELVVVVPSPSVLVILDHPSDLIQSFFRSTMILNETSPGV